MICQTDRLGVQQYNPGDWNEFYALNADPMVKKSIGDALINSVEQEQLEFNRILMAYTPGSKAGKWAVILKKERTLIAACTIRPFGQTEDVEICYRFKPKEWGYGYATELALSLVNYCFFFLSLTRVLATTNQGNYASMSVLCKAGFQFERAMIYQGWPVNYFTNIQSAHI